jgi:hypothetical protein
MTKTRGTGNNIKRKIDMRNLFPLSQMAAWRVMFWNLRKKKRRRIRETMNTLTIWMRTRFVAAGFLSNKPAINVSMNVEILQPMM